MTEMGPPRALSPYLALKSSTAILTASTFLFPVAPLYGPDWSLMTPSTPLPFVNLTAAAGGAVGTATLGGGRGVGWGGGAGVAHAATAIMTTTRIPITR